MCTWATSWRRRCGRQPDPRASSPTSGGGARCRTSSCSGRWRRAPDIRKCRPTPRTGGETSSGSRSTPRWRGEPGTGVRPRRSRTACDGWWSTRGPSLRRRGRAIGAPALVILAAGVGSRYGGPKQIEPVGPAGATLLEYSIFDARRAGLGTVVVVTRPELATAFDRIDATVAIQRLDDIPAGPAGPAGLTMPPARTKPWGTGHAVLAAASAVSGPSA